MTAVRVRSLALDLVPVAAFAGITAVAAQISIPFWPVPFTLQTVATLASGLLLGARRGAASQVAYVGLGAAGLPVFAGAVGGPQILVGPTGGYLLAFVIAAALTGWASERLKGWRLGLAIGGSSALILAIGATWLSFYVGSAAWTSGFLLFVPSEILKSAAAWAGMKGFKK